MSCEVGLDYFRYVLEHNLKKDWLEVVKKFDFGEWSFLAGEKTHERKIGEKSRGEEKSEQKKSSEHHFAFFPRLSLPEEKNENFPLKRSQG